jgi:hypothetical protein
MTELLDEPATASTLTASIACSTSRATSSPSDLDSALPKRRANSSVSWSIERRCRC